MDTVTVLCDLNVAQNVHAAQVPVGGEPYKLNMILKRILNCEENFSVFVRELIAGEEGKSG